MKIAILGCGVVGSGTAEILMNRTRELSQKCDEPIELKYILDIRDLSGTPFAEKAVKSIEEILNDPEVGVVAETMGGVEPAFTFCKRALESGKCVVTSNKQLVAEKGELLFEAAQKHNRAFRFEASVCGVIPVIRSMFTAFASDEIEGFYGILNGTTNFILTKMLKEHMNFDEALKIAQAMGYAERNPAADIEGTDACRKTAILASIAFGSHIKPEEVYTEGITSVTLEDASYADIAGGEIKLLGRASKAQNGGIFAVVSPMIVNRRHMMADVEGVYNALNVKGKYSSDIMFCGHGAGKEATAAAVVSDVIDCVRHPGFNTNYDWEKNIPGKVQNHKEMTTALYVRAETENKNETKAAIQTAFGEVTFLNNPSAPENEIAFITDTDTELSLRNRLQTITNSRILSVIRVMK